MSDHTIPTIDEDLTIIHGTGNTFADLGLPNAEERDKKVQLALSIREVVDASGMTQKAAAAKAGIAAPDLSHIMRGRVTNFSSDRLIDILAALDRDIEIRIRPRRGAKGV